MTVGQLIRLLSSYDSNDEIVVQPDNSDYGEGFTSYISEYMLHSFWGRDRNVIAIKTEQVGALWDVDFDDYEDDYDEDDYDEDDIIL